VEKKTNQINEFLGGRYGSSKLGAGELRRNDCLASGRGSVQFVVVDRRYGRAKVRFPCPPRQYRVACTNLQRRASSGRSGWSKKTWNIHGRPMTFFICCPMKRPVAISKRRCGLRHSRTTSWSSRSPPGTVCLCSRRSIAQRGTYLLPHEIWRLRYDMHIAGMYTGHPNLYATR